MDLNHASVNKRPHTRTHAHGLISWRIVRLFLLLLLPPSRRIVFLQKFLPSLSGSLIEPGVLIFVIALSQHSFCEWRSFLSYFKGNTLG